MAKKYVKPTTRSDGTPVKGYYRKGSHSDSPVVERAKFKSMFSNMVPSHIGDFESVPDEEVLAVAMENIATMKKNGIHPNNAVRTIQEMRINVLDRINAIENVSYPDLTEMLEVAQGAEVENIHTIHGFSYKFSDDITDAEIAKLEELTALIDTLYTEGDIAGEYVPELEAHRIFNKRQYEHALELQKSGWKLDAKQLDFIDVAGTFFSEYPNDKSFKSGAGKYATRFNR